MNYGLLRKAYITEHFGHRVLDSRVLDGQNERSSYYRVVLWIEGWHPSFPRSECVISGITGQKETKIIFESLKPSVVINVVEPLRDACGLWSFKEVA